MTNPICLAVDLPRLDAAKALVTQVATHIGMVKLGLEFFCAHGRAGVLDMGHLGLPVFLDLKLHDIPNTVARAMQALSMLEPAVVTVHAAGGRAMMEDAKAAAPPHTKVVAVTALTSLDQRDLERSGVTGTIADQVRRLADLAQLAGLDGIVCSGHEVEAVRSSWPGGYFVVPGLRLDDAGTGDQKRVVTPRQARDRGGSLLVVGRPISRAADPLAAARAIEATL
ncbi:orotidine-5'-phosphate decarboxylase [Erythrobacteraceae bacterium CFH 75059]|uniref:orotidine-5'-phosphate decarboxylase n=1 Tax=Qipengyuania thermophila TaxID=2509361 RepID=UPI0010206B6E|nr:orotidine-5'-phosphate decarboxylase [Qipengyuania thermophila]TCD05399.1 orotidine-5'-phosphate decarboxylase [Erythrobacteraceae bacterium CFH 75059]